MSLLPYAYLQKTMTNLTLVHMTSRDREAVVLSVVEAYLFKGGLAIGRRRCTTGLDAVASPWSYWRSRINAGI
jgi:hypothetical protein